jgi:alkanesulfonate monooxygenase SsuD/methylene tetrahydromethanopterin reductase-like flavin-dependent oxidoreductase (luciferase family)
LDRQTVLDFAEKFCLVGRPVDVIEKIERLRKRGINNFYLRHLFSYELPETEVKTFSEEIIPSLS